MTPDKRPVEINMSGIPVSGVGGLGLVAIAALMTVVLPEAWALVVAGGLGGVVLGVALIVVHRVRRTPGPSGNDPTILFRAEQESPQTVASRERLSRNVRLAAARI